MRNYLKWLLLLLILCLTWTGVSAQESVYSQVSVVNAPLFDQQTGMVQVDVMVRGAQGLPVSDLTLQNFTFDGSVAEVSLSPRTELPLTLAIIVDTSVGSSIDLIKDTLLAYFEHYHQPQDNVTFYVVNFDEIALRRFSEDAVTSLEDAVSSVNALHSGESYYFVKPALDAALNDLLAQAGGPLNPRQALFVGSFLNRPREASLATAFAEAGIPLHVVQAHRYRDQETGVYRSLASYGGGLFANNQDGLLVLGESHEPINLLKVLFDTINNSRLVYTLVFQPDNVSAGQQQQVTIDVDLPDGSQPQVAVPYTLDLLPPAVTFVSADLLEIALEPTVGADSALVFDNSHQPLTLQVSYPDNVVRLLHAATVTITDQATARTLQVLQVMNPKPDENGFITLDWELTPLQELEDMDILLAAVVTDGAGLTGTASQMGSITVAPVDQLVASIAAGNVLDSGPQQASLLNIPLDTELLILGVNIIFVFITLILLGFAILRRRTGSPVTPSGNGLVLTAPETTQQQDDSIVAEAVDADEGSDAVEPEQYGQLITRNGRDEIGVQHALITKVRFLIGRTPECNLIVNQPYVSPEHCLITFHDNRFFVRDLGSKNGTYVNGERIRQANVEVDVPLGSEISITRNIVLEIRGLEYQVTLDGDDGVGKTAYSTVAHENVEFKRLPGLRYAPDQGAAIDDNYSPI
ncbi:FHA domain-containing protein [Chloroflexota bacterium]